MFIKLGTKSAVNANDASVQMLVIVQLRMYWILRVVLITLLMAVSLMMVVQKLVKTRVLTTMMIMMMVMNRMSLMILVICEREGGIPSATN